MTTERMLAAVLNQQLASPLRIEIVSAEPTRATGQMDLGELAATVAARLTESEALPRDGLPQESVIEQDGLRLVLLVRERAADEGSDPSVVVEPAS